MIVECGQAVATFVVTMRNRLNQTLKLRVSREMMDALVRIAEAKSLKRGCNVGYSTIVREAIIAHLEEQEERLRSPAA
jgi:hypothetical protein